jgi:hypothetical protein
MARLHDQLQYFVSHKVSTDKIWQIPTVILSGHQVKSDSNLRKGTNYYKLLYTNYNRRYKLLLRLLDTRSHLSLENKLLIYRTILKPMWTYGLELWGSAKPSNLKRIQTLPSFNPTS